MISWAVTDKGNVRKQNQDAFYTYISPDKELSILLVCDGMGGARAGNVASELAISVFKTEARRMLSTLDGDDLLAEVQRCIEVSNTAVYELSKNDPDCHGMGTTLVTAVIKGDVLYVANVGDSRAYLISDGQIRQITRDHSLVEDMVERGDITREESRVHPNKNLITRAVGTVDTVECDTFHENIKSGDFVLLCSDGLTNLVPDEELMNVVTGADSVKNSCNALLNLALSRGAPDNVTVVLIEK